MLTNKKFEIADGKSDSRDGFNPVTHLSDEAIPSGYDAGSADFEKEIGILKNSSWEHICTLAGRRLVFRTDDDRILIVGDATVHGLKTLRI